MLPPVAPGSPPRHHRAEAIDPRPYTEAVPEEHLYDLYRRGMALLESGDFEQATVPLSKAARLAPEKSSIREALGRAYFRARRYPEAAAEVEAGGERYPGDDHAPLFLR